MPQKIILNKETVKSSLTIFHLKNGQPIMQYPEGDIIEALKLLSSGLDIAVELVKNAMGEENKPEASRILMGGAICPRCRRPVQDCVCENPFAKKKG